MIGVQGPLKNGKIYRVVTSSGSKDFNINKYGKRAARKLAQDYADKWNDAVKTDTAYLINADYTVNEIIDKFIMEFEKLVDLPKPKRVKASLSGYRNLLKRVSDTEYGNKHYTIVMHHCLQIEKELSKTWSTDAVHKTMKALKYAYTTCKKSKIIQDNPMSDYIYDSGATNTDTDEDVIEVVIPTINEFNSILKVASPKWRLFYKLAATTGMRVSELRGLTFSNIDFIDNFILVRQQADQSNKLTTRLKTKRANRDIPLHEDLKNELLNLRSQMDVVPTIGHNSQIKGVKTDLIFPSAANTPHSRQHIWDKFYAYKKAAGVNFKGSIHCLRHYYASSLIDLAKFKGKEVSTKEISTMLGHASYTFTETVYGHLIYPRKDRQKLVRDISSASNFSFSY